MIELSQADGGLLSKGFAGDTFNTAWYARGCMSADWSVDYFTAVGDDRLSDEMIAFMTSAGIGTGYVARVQNKAPGLYIIHLENGERSFSYWRQNSAARGLASNPRLLRAALDASDVIYFSGITLAILPREDARTMLTELKGARLSGKHIVFDPNLRPRLWESAEAMRTTISEGARVSTIVMPSYDDEAQFFDDVSISATAERYHGLGAAVVVVKNGGAGVTVSADGINALVPAVKVARVVDSTSAGDSFNAAFLAEYFRQRDGIAAARLGVEAASRVIQKHGALVPLGARSVRDLPSL